MLGIGRPKQDGFRLLIADVVRSHGRWEIGFFQRVTIDTEIKAKRNNIISELITFRIAKAKANVKFGVKPLCKHQCERSSVPININMKAKATKCFLEGGERIKFTLNVYGKGSLAWKLNLRTGPPGPYDLPGKMSEIIRTGNVPPPHEHFRGDPVLVHGFRFLV